MRVSMVRRQFKQQVSIVASGGDPAGVRPRGSDPVVSLTAGNYVLPAS